MKEAMDLIMSMYTTGYSPADLIQTLFKVTRSHSTMPESEKLEYLREIGFTHMRISEGLNTQLQLMGCVARLCQFHSHSSAKFSI
jgi:replication factor C subunit 2/4